MLPLAAFPMRCGLLLFALVLQACAAARPERISFQEAIAAEKPAREPKKQRATLPPGVAAPSPELQSALLLFGNALREGRGAAPKGAAMPPAQVEAWDRALAGVDGFLKRQAAQMSPYDLVRARIVLEAELEADAARWGDFPAALASRTQALLEGLKARHREVTALRVKVKPVDPRRFVWPTEPVVVTSPFGFRFHPLTGDYRPHKGVDLLAEPAQAVYAPYAGTVVFSGWNGSYGKHVELQHDVQYATTYSHLMTLMVKDGDVVKKGQLLGLAGDTGNATGVHLHFELYRAGHPVDPELLLPPVYDFSRVAAGNPVAW